MAEVQFSDIIQVAAIGLTLATLKLGLEQFLTKSLLAERQDILNREKEFEIENKAGVDELQETIQHGDKSGETKTEQNLTLYRNKQDALQILDITESIKLYISYWFGKGFKISFTFLHMTIVLFYAILVYFAAMQLSKMPSIIEFNSWLLSKICLEYSTVTIFNFTVLTFICQTAVLAYLVKKTTKLRTKLHEYSSELSKLSRQILVDIRLMEQTKAIEKARSTS